MNKHFNKIICDEIGVDVLSFKLHISLDTSVWNKCCTEINNSVGRPTLNTDFIRINTI